MSRLPALGPRGEGWVAIQAVLFALVAASGWFLPGTMAPAAATVATVSGAVLIACGLALAVGGLRGLQDADALTALPHPRDESRLRETGAYRLARHPVYGGLVLGAIGWAVVRTSPWALAAALALFVFFDLKRRREEVWLRERYPGYAAYAARTRRLLPWIY